MFVVAGCFDPGNGNVLFLHENPCVGFHETKFCLEKSQNFRVFCNLLIISMAFLVNSLFLCNLIAFRL